MKQKLQTLLIIIRSTKKDLNELLRLLEKESEVAIKWFSDNNMIVNLKKFQAITINRHAEIKSTESVTL